MGGRARRDATGMNAFRHYRPAKDLTGWTFGRLGVVRRNVTHSRFAAWLCVCVCGTEKTVGSHLLSRGLTQSCGCLRREVAAQTGRITRGGTVKVSPPAWCADALTKAWA
jgi:hypothetical protein